MTSGKVSCSSWSHLTWRFLLPLRQLSWLTGPSYWSISSGQEIASKRQSSNSPKGSFLLHNHSQAYYVKTQEGFTADSYTLKDNQIKACSATDPSIQCHMDVFYAVPGHFKTSKRSKELSLVFKAQQ